MHHLRVFSISGIKFFLHFLPFLYRKFFILLLFQSEIHKILSRTPGLRPSRPMRYSGPDPALYLFVTIYPVLLSTYCCCSGGENRQINLKFFGEFLHWPIKRTQLVQKFIVHEITWSFWKLRINENSDGGGGGEWQTFSHNIAALISLLLHWFFLMPPICIFFTPKILRMLKRKSSALRLRGGNSDTGFSSIPMLTYGEILPHVYSLHNSFN